MLQGGGEQSGLQVQAFHLGGIGGVRAQLPGDADVQGLCPARARPSGRASQPGEAPVQNLHPIAGQQPRLRPADHRDQGRRLFGAVAHQSRRGPRFQAVELVVDRFHRHRDRHRRRLIGRMDQGLLATDHRQHPLKQGGK